MKKFYFYVMLCLGSCLNMHAQGNMVTLGTPTGNSQEVGITGGDLSVSPSGAANYTTLFSLPPGINGVVPQVGLIYNSMGGNDWAGYNFSIMGISKIEAINTTDYVDGDTEFGYKRLSLDGQRLMLKTGTYGSNTSTSTSTYDTENFSNITVEQPVNAPAQIRYIVYYPDGSKGYYRYLNDGVAYISYWENAQGVRITYNYEGDSEHDVRISSITYGSVGTAAAPTTISFIYKARNRNEQANITDNGSSGSYRYSTKLLSEVRITSNGVGFKNYKLDYISFTSGYELLSKITESSGDGTKSLNPTVFNYNQTPKNILYDPVQTTEILTSNVDYNNTAAISGDFDDDGKMDVVLYLTQGTSKYAKFALFRDLKPGGQTSSPPVLVNTGLFEEIFATNYLSVDGSNYRLNSTQGIGYVQNSGTTIAFNTLAWVPSGQTFINQYTLTATQAVLGGSAAKSYLAGDFNGDGITDMMAVVKSTGACYFVNLDSRLNNNNFVTSLGIIAGGLSTSDKLSVVDYNGDGKSDLVVIKNGILRIYCLRNNDTQLYSIGATSHTSISPTAAILFGDYNGDGKSDFMIPAGYGNTYYQFLATGSIYDSIYSNNPYNVSTRTLNVPYMESLTSSSGCSFVYHLIPSDFDNDGKTDFIAVENQVCNTSGQWKGYLYPKYFMNTGSNFINVAESSTDWQPIADIDHYALPVFLKSDKVHSGKDLCFVSNNKMYRFTSQMDVKQEVLVRNVVDGNGYVQEIHYEPLKPCSTQGCVSTYISDEGQLNYPYFDIVSSDDTYIVSKLVKYSSNSSAPTYIQQVYSYWGAVTSLDGLGFLGFKGIVKTNWHEVGGNVISSVSKNDVTKRGATTETYEVLGLTSANQPTPSNYISRTLNTIAYTTYANKSFSVNPSTVTMYNGLQNTSSTSAMTYDTYNNALTISTTDKQGFLVMRISKITNTYDNQVSGGTYYIGRLTNVATEITADSNTMTSEKAYTYTNNLLTQLKEKGNATDYITTTLVNDAFGNVTQATVSTTNVTPRVTKAEYDASGIYLLKSTGVDGLKTEYTYYTNTAGLTGKLKTIKNPYGRITTYAYDVLGKNKKLTDYLGKSITLTYTKLPLSETQIESVGDDGSYSMTIYDDLGRKRQSGVKLLQGDITYIDTEYDALNRISRVSEPHISSTSLYTGTTYDSYGRIATITEPSGKVNTYSYTGLSQTINNGTTTESVTRSVTGNIVSRTDMGGSISYKYYPNNNLKESSYGGVITKFYQDGWGRKTRIEDPSAGIFDYEYYGLGELKKQTTPKGNIQFTYDNFGKPIKKDATDITGGSFSSDYTYDSVTQLPDNTLMTDIDNHTHGSVYTYDQYKRTTKVDEKLTFLLPTIKNINFSKTYTYDAFGRIDTETSYSICEGQTTSTTIQYSYKNGYLWKITDSATSQILYEATSMSERGQKGNAKMANGVMDAVRTYDQYGFAATESYGAYISGLRQSRLSLTTNFNAQTGNLSNRTYSSDKTLVNRGTESFTYDSLDRLKTFPTPIGTIETNDYDTKGRITNNNIGSYTYPSTGKVYQQSQLQLTESGRAYYYNREGIFNEGMENKDAFVISDPTNVSYSQTKAYSGVYSLKVNNTTGVEKTMTTAEKVNISNNAPTDYIVSAWVYSEGPATELNLVMTAGGSTTMSSQPETVTGTWKMISKTITVPQAVTSLAIRVDSESNGVVYFDDLKIVKASDATAQRTLDVSYNRDGNPIDITESGVDKLSFEYDAEGRRAAMFYGSMATNIMDRPYRKYYSTTATNIEVKHNTISGAVEFVTYIGGNGYDAPIAFIKSGASAGSYVYLLRDYQGSILQILNSTGTTIESRSFDAWGNIIKVVNGSNALLKGLTILDRGYTGHEHLQSVRLIHMNGRLYDPVVRRFLQPDSHIQDPFNTQNYNAYGYVLNNPLRYTDPSGETYGDGYTYYNIPAQNNGGETGGPSGAQQSLIGSAIYTIANNWDDWHIKDWFNDNFSNAVKDGMHGIANAARFVGRNVRSAIKDIGNLLGFGGGEPRKTTIQAPGFSNFNGGTGWQNSGFNTKTNGEGGLIRSIKNVVNSIKSSIVDNASTVWNHPVTRSYIPDFATIGVGFSGIAGVGGSTSIELNWVTRGSDASFIPIATVTQSVGGGFSIDATVNVGGASFLGHVKDIKKTMLVTDTRKNGDFPTAWGSAGLTAGGKVGVTGTYTYTDKGYGIIGRYFNFGGGLPLGPLPINAAGGASNTYIIKEWE